MCAVIHNHWRKADAPDLSVADFLFAPPGVAEERDATLQQGKVHNMITAFHALAASSGGRTPRRRKARRP